LWVCAKTKIWFIIKIFAKTSYKQKKITVFGGDQSRPNIHIDDITDVYLHLLENPQLTGIYNAGFENIKIIDIANNIQNIIPCEIIVTESNDPRSYRVNSDKLLNTGFKPKKNVAMAIEDIINAYNKGDLKNEEKFYNLTWMEINKFY